MAERVRSIPRTSCLGTRHLGSISNINAATSTQPYADAMLMIAHFYKRTGEIQQEVVSSVPDKAMQTQLGGYCNQVSLTYHNLLVMHAEYIEYYNLINKNYFFITINLL